MEWGIIREGSLLEMEAYWRGGLLERGLLEGRLLELNRAFTVYEKCT